MKQGAIDAETAATEAKVPVGDRYTEADPTKATLAWRSLVVALAQYLAGARKVSRAEVSLLLGRFNETYPTEESE